MAGDLLLTGLSGLTAFKNVLNTTSQNIANVATEGYSRQRVDLEARNPQLTGAGFITIPFSAANLEPVVPPPQN
jgi:flagellar hook-associated protein 1 FlgK